MRLQASGGPAAAATLVGVEVRRTAGASRADEVDELARARGASVEPADRTRRPATVATRAGWRSSTPRRSRTAAFVARPVRDGDAWSAFAQLSPLERRLDARRRVGPASRRRPTTRSPTLVDDALDLLDDGATT